MLELAAVICGDPGKKELPKADETGAETTSISSNGVLSSSETSIANPEKISWPISPCPTKTLTEPFGSMLMKSLGENARSWSKPAANEVMDSPMMLRTRPFLALARKSLLD
jgi:hypothetical protein